MNDLKPCPFCGGEVILETVDGNSPEECYIYCPECDFESGVYSEPKFIVEKWNRRADVVHAEWVVCGDGDNVPWMCSHCGKTTAHKYKVIYGKYCPHCGAKMDRGDSDEAD